MKPVQGFHFQDHEDAKDPQHYCLVEMMWPGRVRSLVGRILPLRTVNTTQNPHVLDKCVALNR